MKKTIYKRILSLFLVTLIMFGTSFTSLAATSNMVKIDGNDQDIPDKYGVKSLELKKYEDVNSNDNLLDFEDNLFKGIISDDGKNLNWQSKDNVLVKYVFVKGGDAGNLYIYNEDGTITTTSDSGLVSPLNNGENVPKISHITFYYEVVHQPEVGNLEITKTIDQKGKNPPHPGVTFELYQGDQLIKTGITSSQGKLRFEGLPVGDYKLKEIVPEGYESSINGFSLVTIRKNKTTSESVVNKLSTGNIKVIKKDQDGKSQKDITFNLYKGESLKATGKTNNAGVLEFKGLPIGEYKLEEVVPTWYKSSLVGLVSVLVSKNDTNVVNVTNTKVGNIEIVKTIDKINGQVHEDVEFKLIQGKTVKATGRTDEHGKVLFEGVLPGNYKVEEVVPSGYVNILNGIAFVRVIGGRTERVNVVNKAITGSIIVNKEIAGSRLSPDKKGIIFNLYQEGELVQSKKTNNFGIIVFTNLPLGEYQLEEVVPDGYTSSIDGLMTITLSLKNRNETVKVVNTKIKYGNIEIIKKDNGGNPQGDIEFELYSGEDKVASGKTDDNGILKLNKLVVGEYQLKEIVPTGYESDLDDMTSVIVKNRKTTVINVINTLITGGIEVIKTIDSIDGDPQEDVTFNLYQNEEEVASGVTDSDGKVVFEGLVPGEYFLEEIAPDGYESSIDGLLAVDVVGKEVSSVNVINSLITGGIKVIKTIDSIDGNPQEDVTFNLYQNEEEVASGVTDSDGKVVFEGLVPGEYFLEEIAPDGYESSIDGLLAVDVVGKEVSSVNVINSLITGGIKVIKTIDSIDGNPQEGVTFNLYQNEEEVDSKVTDSEGIVVFEGLVPGEYF
ncbi:hypothetical protein GC105_16180, partial [Alkalibaculum sp. M08DMB]